VERMCGTHGANHACLLQHRGWISYIVGERGYDLGRLIAFMLNDRSTCPTAREMLTTHPRVSAEVVDFGSSQAGCWSCCRDTVLSADVF